MRDRVVRITIGSAVLLVACGRAAEPPEGDPARPELATVSESQDHAHRDPVEPAARARGSTRALLELGTPAEDVGEPLARSPESGHSLAGRVVDDREDPVTGAFVSVFCEGDGAESRVCRTGHDGTFSFELPSQPLGVLASRTEPNGEPPPGMPLLAEMPAIRNLHESPGDAERRIDLVLPRPARLAGVVVDAAGRGVEAELVAQVETPQHEFDTADWGPIGRTRPDGTFELTVSPGGLHLFARAQGRAPSDVLVLGVEPATTPPPARLVLPEGGVVEALLLDSAGVPAEGYRVDLSGSESTYSETATTGVDGRARFEAVPAGWLSLHVPGSYDTGTVQGSMTLCRASLELAADEHRTVTLQLPEEDEVEVSIELFGAAASVEGGW